MFGRQSIAVMAPFPSAEVSICRKKPVLGRGSGWSQAVAPHGSAVLLFLAECCQLLLTCLLWKGGCWEGMRAATQSLHPRPCPSVTSATASLHSHRPLCWYHRCCHWCECDRDKAVETVTNQNAGAFVTVFTPNIKFLLVS